MRKKAQTATEYLIILAVVIIIALIVVGVMGGIPGIGGQAGGRTSQAYWSTADVAFTSYSVSPSEVNLVTQNNLPGSVTINSVSLDGTDVAADDVPVTLNSGQTITLDGAEVTCTSGSYSYTVEINYTDESSGATYIFDGDGQDLEGTCAT